MSTANLFQPFTCKSLTIPNRIVMAPMTRAFSPDGIPTEEMAKYYQRRAAAEVGLIISEGTGVDRPHAINEPGVPHFHGEALPAWGRTVKAVHDVGGTMAPQLWHVGNVPLVSTPRETWHECTDYEGPSGLRDPDTPVGKAMSDADIADVITAFARAARDAQELGFDAVELHGAHGYLIDQFFWHETNRRTDGWGGDTLRARASFAAELLCAVRSGRPRFPDHPAIVAVESAELR